LPAPASLAPGVDIWQGFLDRPAQAAMLADIRAVAATAPLFTPRMPRTGKPFSVRMTNCGALGWVSDPARGYRYEATHPVTGAPWPPIPETVLAVWRTVSRCEALPEACLVNFYDADARMGAHQDRDEQALDAPIVSISLGDSCRFRFGGPTRGGRTRSLTLDSGDVLVFGGPARLMFHGVDRILPGTSTLLPQGGRINLTLRRVTPVRVAGQGSSGESQ
jgi:DNA oxidative demethylase